MPDARLDSMRACVDAAAVAQLYAADCANSTVLITGASSGFGLETARALASAGATIVLACRAGAKAEAALAAVRAAAMAGSGGDSGRVHMLALDLASPSSVRDCVLAYDVLAPSLPRAGALTALVLNAGCLGLPWPEGAPEPMLQVNLLGHAALHAALRPRLLAAGADARLVVVASASHHRLNGPDLDWAAELPPQRASYDEHRAYAFSNLCRVLWARALAAREPYPVVSLHPACSGGTEAGRHMGAWSLMRLLSLVLYWEWRGILEFQSAAAGARTQTFLAVAPISQVRPLTGKYLSGNVSDGPLGEAVEPSVLAKSDANAARVLAFVDLYVANVTEAPEPV